MVVKYALSLIVVVALSTVHSWNLPQLPSGRRSQYFLLHNDGGYKYGYDTGIGGHFAKEAGDPQNEVAGHYAYKDPSGRDIDVKYTSGVKGFMPEGLENLVPQEHGPYAPAQGYSHPVPTPYSSEGPADDQANTGDSSYSFNIDTDTYKRQESSDPSGNVQGRYSYSNAAGHHDLSYVAGSNTGFVATSGSLSVPNGLEGKSVPVHAAPTAYSAPGSSAPVSPNADGSYSFSYSAGDHSREESSDAKGNVQGRYSFNNEAGTHDLSYVAGSETGFQPTGGSLSHPNGLDGKSVPVHAAPTAYSAPGSNAPVSPNADGSYAFSYSAGDHSREESSDANGNVQGRYSFNNEAGTHDLSYVAGSETGFQPTGGSLSHPNGLDGKSVPHSDYHPSSHHHPTTYSANYEPAAPNSDGSYSFDFSTNDQSRQESSDASGNVQGKFSYTNAAGTHDLSFVAGSETGFQPTGGSLSVPNGVSGSPAHAGPSPVSRSYVPASQDDGSYHGDESSTDHADEPGTGDASYSFTVDTDEYQRKESSDAKGNVVGSYSYKNAAGSHDLGYVAGSETGFVATDGSLAVPNGLHGASPDVAQGRYLPPQGSHGDDDGSYHGEEPSTGDASYSFTVDTDEYQRKESSDAKGNVVGSYSYKNAAGSHDLGYVAGSQTGFVANHGSLALPNGLSGSHGAVPNVAGYLPPQARSSVDFVHSPSGESKVGNFVVKTYYPSKSQSKYGYIFESK